MPPMLFQYSLSAICWSKVGLLVITCIHIHRPGDTQIRTSQITLT
jgi:hypothetical protein